MLRSILPSLLLLAFCLPASLPAQKSAEHEGSILRFTMPSIDGRDVDLSRFSGNVVLIVNTASKCGYTPQYAALETLYKKYHARGLRILAFPANNFGAQEPGSNMEIQKFCTTNYHVSFDLFSRISVKGGDIHPLYAALTTTPGVEGDIKWNFTKFLVDRSGRPAARFEPRVDPLSNEFIATLEDLLGK